MSFLRALGYALAVSAVVAGCWLVAAAIIYVWFAVLQWPWWTLYLASMFLVMVVTAWAFQDD